MVRAVELRVPVKVVVVLAVPGCGHDPALRRLLLLLQQHLVPGHGLPGQDGDRSLLLTNSRRQGQWRQVLLLLMHDWVRPLVLLGQDWVLGQPWLRTLRQHYRLLPDEALEELLRELGRVGLLKAGHPLKENRTNQNKCLRLALTSC